MSEQKPSVERGGSVKRYFVVILEKSTGTLVRRIECGTSYRMAEKTERGVNINLDRARFLTDIRVEAEAEVA